METIHFKMIGQKTPNKKMILVAVVSEDFLGEVPEIFSVEAQKVPQTIYTGTYPTIKINTDSINDITEESKGNGIGGIVMKESWYVKKTKENDMFGVGL